MAFISDDWILELASGVPGILDFALGGAVTNYLAFSSFLADDDSCYYVAINGGDRETGIGTYTLATNTLVRTAVVSSTNADAKVSFGAGTRVFCEVSAKHTLSRRDALVRADAFKLMAPGDETKRVVFNVNTVATATERTWTAPDRSIDFGTLLDYSLAQSLTDAQKKQVRTNIGGTPIGVENFYAGLTAPSGWAFEYGQNESRTTYADLWAALHKSATVTMTIATPGVVTWTSHGLKAGDTVRFYTTGALPTNVSANTTYYVIASGLATNTFQIATTDGGSAINTSGSQSGVHTAVHAPHGYGDGSTTFTFPDWRGRAGVGRDDMNGTSANRLTGLSGGVNGDILAAAGGAESHTLTTAQLANHTHGLFGGHAAVGSGTANAAAQVNSGFSMNATAAEGSGQAHNNVQPSLVRNVIIFHGVF